MAAKLDPDSVIGNPANWINRDLSLIAFNSRVLAQAEDQSLPLLDRVKFLAIVNSNLDEFFMVRVAYIRRVLREGEVDTGPDRMTPWQLLETISEQVRALVDRIQRCWLDDLFPALKAAGITLLSQDEYTPEEVDYLNNYFREQILPVLTPMAIDTSHPFPLLTNGVIYILLRAQARLDIDGVFFSKADTVLVQLPIGLRRFIRLPASDGSTACRIALLEDVVMRFAGQLLRGYEITGAHTFRVTRDADISVDEEQVENLMAAIEEELRRSRWGAPVRLVVGSAVPDEEMEYLRKLLHLEPMETYRAPGFLDMKGLFGLLGLVEHPDLVETPWPPQPHPAFIDREDDIFEVVREQDVLLHHPYQSFDPVVRFIEQAADDPDVLAIKITLYRVSGQSPIVRALIRAAEQGKQVTALVELRARFDEEANISWARRLDAAGAHVIYGVMGYKTHSKAALVIRRESDGIRRYCHLATGNYNDRTARQYTDLGLLTSSPAFGADVSAFFNVITGYSLPPVWNRIEMAPTGLRARTVAMIRREVEKHTPETPGFIRAKFNALVDPGIIKELYKASQSGVKIDLLVRGMCRLRPGVPGLSETITVTSIVDRFLEHPRIFHYRNGGNEEVYMSSADWMERNLNRRLELLFPVVEPALKAELLAVLDAGFADNSQGWRLDQNGLYVRRTPLASEKPMRSQQMMYERAVLAAKKTSEEKRHEVFRPLSNPRPSKRRR